MNAAAIATCPYPGCGLAEEHDGDHSPQYKFIKRYRWWQPGCTNLFPGHCQTPGCENVAGALYHNVLTGKAHEVCCACEQELIRAGKTTHSIESELASPVPPARTFYRKPKRKDGAA